jgi:adenosylcobinamide-GDP ribazoletransferase
MTPPAPGARRAAFGGRVGAALVHELRLAAVALQFLTRVPVPARVGFEPDWLNACVRHFPLVGAAVGAVGGVVLAGASTLWPPAVAALLALAATVALTGAFHEDGLADTFDALGGVVSRERALAIMKDSRIGTYGAAALALSLALRAAAMAVLCAWPAPALVAAVVLSHTLGRTVAVTVMAALPYAGDAEHAKAKPLALAVRPVHWAPAIVQAALVVAACMAWGGVPVGAVAAAGGAAAGVAVGMRGWLRRRLGGYTGDGLGASEQLAELAVLLALTAAWGAGSP